MVCREYLDVAVNVPSVSIVDDQDPVADTDDVEDGAADTVLDVDPVDTDEMEPVPPRRRRKIQRPARLDDYVVGGVESAES